MKNVIIGIDMSKVKLDLCVRVGDIISQEIELSNSISELTKFFKKLLKTHTASEVLICCEHTGHYTYPLSCVCEDLSLDLWLENAFQIKHSIGLVRGKDDKVDARRIAEYAIRFQDKSKLFCLPDKHISSLRLLLSERDLYMSDKRKYQGQLSDQERFMSKADFADKKKRLSKQLKALEANIYAIDKKIKKLIANDETLSNQHELLCSVDGVGTVTATMMIVETNAFKDFDNARKFCCHSGVAPFEYTSGSSVRSKRKVSHRADKSIKAILHLAALSVATRNNGSELRKYFLRKVAEGKNKMSVLNAIRAKLVLRMFAVIKNNKPYEKEYMFKFT
jgi:transposase